MADKSYTNFISRLLERQEVESWDFEKIKSTYKLFPKEIYYFLKKHNLVEEFFTPRNYILGYWLDFDKNRITFYRTSGEQFTINYH